MAAVEEKSSDFYAVLGLKKECTASELRNAYKKLAMKWHPDRCSASGNSKYVEEAKKKFQSVQQAYSVLSDANKRFLYDVGAYDCDDDDDENGMGDFLNEMVSMMSKNKSNENKNESFQDLQDLFDEIFYNENDVFGSCSQSSDPTTRLSSNKRNASEISSETFSIQASPFEGFPIGENIVLERVRGERIETTAGGSRRDGRKQKISSAQDISSNGISA